VIVEFTVVPLGQGEALGERVAKVVDIVDRSGLPYQLTAMGTIVEGEWSEVLDLIKECHGYMRRFASRVVTTITIDDREKAKDRIRGKVEDIEKVLDRQLKK
jgi:uncharacterized protein (TIGR00106 family)